MSYVMSLLPRFVIPAIGLASMALLSFLYVIQPHAYQSIMEALIRFPGPHPFADWDWLQSNIRCWAQGADAYNRTCFAVWPDVLFDYSPLWLRASFIPTETEWLIPIALSMNALFLLSLALLPSPGTKTGFLLTLLATLSSATALGLERANADVAMFLLVIVGVSLCTLRLPFRLVGYALLTVAGLLKFYPMVALAIALRERPAVAVAVAVAAAAALAALLFGYPEELMLVVRNLPKASSFTLQFGAADLPSGLGAITAKLLYQDSTDARGIGKLLSDGLLLLSMVLAVMIAVSLGRRYSLQSAMARLPAGQANFLVAGAALICGCFFVGQNVIYRGIFLLLALPGLLALSHHLPTPQARAAFGSTCLAISFVLCILFIEWCLGIAGLLHTRPDYQADPYLVLPDIPVGFMVWLCSELAWWWIVTVLLAVLGTFVLNSELWTVLTRSLRLP